MGVFRMPSLGSDMEAGTLTEWLVKPGDAVKRGDIIAVIETQKGAIEIEVFEDGVVEELQAVPGTTVPVGTPLAVIRGEGEAEAAPEPAASAAAVAEAPPAPSEARPAASAEIRPPDPQSLVTATRIRISPAARRLAERLGIDAARLAGSGPGGAIVLADVEKAQPAAPAPDGMSGMRAAIAAAMVRSKREIPHYYLAHTVDIGAAEDFVARANKDRGPADRLLLAALFVKAVALAVGKYPEFNGFFDDGAFTPAPSVHAGMAINLRGGGLVAPAIHDAQGLSLDAVMAAMRDLVTRVRAGRFRQRELSDPTITISSLGERGVDLLAGVIYPPQVAILGFGTPAERPWVRDGKVVAARTVTLTLSADHRVSDGHRGALFLNRIGRLLLEPETL
ncbi:branched-chain alpha-keto acid dehydrogenase subunit E2 [Zhengella mangrovi]|uniref:Dihydrolipoamide acetyltransferase component of pyruvate dehydrogenase complex n=1 Tax=Zhengella mangrovi TaxID=1982044 RepID=A0A2G1QKD4_9HYPH|nr:dihydrolipoamide acetyltransferase family protein [Zhengella mangrovi]PHP65921.1 branched-chain alpha-keto acid dehydrogenase subunit E2 [Zhengella mangrovi]